MVADPAAAPDLTDPPVAAAGQFRFVLDEAAFMDAIERPDYLAAADLMPVLAVLAGH